MSFIDSFLKGGLGEALDLGVPIDQAPAQDKRAQFAERTPPVDNVTEKRAPTHPAGVTLSPLVIGAAAAGLLLVVLLARR